MRKLALPPESPPREIIRYHAVQRLWQRRGIALSDAQYENLCSGIKLQMYPVHGMGAHKRPVYLIRIQGKKVYAVWRPDFECICTFFTHATAHLRDGNGKQLRQEVKEIFREARA